MFERFTEKAVNAITLAEQESRRLGHNYIGTEQILLGLIAEGTSIAAEALASFGVHLKDARVAVKSIIGSSSGSVPREIPYTPRAKHVLLLAAEAAQNLRHDYIAPEHLLLGLVREGDGVAIRVLRDAGVDPSVLQTRVMQVIDGIKVPGAAEALTLPKWDADDDEEYPRASSREEALLNLYDLYTFLKADSEIQEFLDGMEDEGQTLGVYVNAPDDILIICKNGIHWLDGEARTYIEYKLIDSVELPQSDDDPHLKLVVRPKNTVVYLPVLHKTEDYPDFFTVYDFISFYMRPRTPERKMDIQDIQSRDDLVCFLRQPNIKTAAIAELASWLEHGDPKPTWLSAVNISPELLQDPSVWRLLALILLRFPECAETE